MHVDLPSGGSAELRDPETLRNRDRKTVLVGGELLTRAHIRDLVARGLPLADARNAASTSLATVDAVLQHIVEAWSFDLPLPSEKIESLEDITVEDYDALAEAARECRKRLFPDFSPTPDPDSPTEPSSD